MTSWVSLGLDPDLFWRSTPRECEMIAAGVNERLRVEHNLLMKAAYYGAVLTFADKRPDLEKLLIPAAKVEPRQTWQQQIAVARQWSAMARGQ